MRKLTTYLAALLVALALVTVSDAAHLGSGAALPATCAVGDTYTLLPSDDQYDCRRTNVWVKRHQIHASALELPDNVQTPVWSVPLTTSNTGCTGGGNTVAHSGITIVAIVNNAGTVSGSVTDSGEAVVGTGCGASCDTWTVTVSGTTATLQATFNNTLSVTAGLTYRVLNNSCGTLTEL